MAKKPQFIPEQCQQCRFFLREEPRDEAGYCRRNPPVFVHFDPDEDMALFSFPMVAVDEWCGCFTPVSQ